MGKNHSYAGGQRRFPPLCLSGGRSGNPGLTDLFTRQFRKVAQEQQKSSVLQKLKQELPAHKPAAPKKREPER